MSCEKRYKSTLSSLSNFRHSDNPELECLAFTRLQTAFNCANLKDEERLHGEAFIELCALTKTTWKDEIGQLKLENFSIVVQRLIEAEINENAFEAAVWRRSLANFVLAIIYRPMDRQLYLQDYFRVLLEKSCEMDLEGKNEIDFLTRNERSACKHYMNAIAKILLEYEKQSRVMYNYAIDNIIAKNLFSQAKEILLVVADAGGFASSQMISQIFKQHVNLNDDLKQLYDAEILFRQGQSKSRVFVLAPLKNLIGNIQTK